MNLFLLRHGEAESPGPVDSGRELTERGRRHILSVARQFQARNAAVERCFVSPYTRALQTAEIFLPVIDDGMAPETEALLRPEVRASEVMRFLGCLEEENILLISHNPLLSELHALLTDGDISNMPIIGTGELVAIDMDIIGLGMGRVRFHLVPDAAIAGV